MQFVQGDWIPLSPLPRILAGGPHTLLFWILVFGVRFWWFPTDVSTALFVGQENVG